ncbi:MAG: hypothetical protein ACRDKA_01940 [Actinomycetota bacterium]
MTVELNEAQRTLMDCYRTLAGVLETHRDRLAPFEERNALKALASLWQVANGLDQDPGQVYHLGA